MADPIPVRNLAERGIVTDIPAWDLPPNAFSNGSNVRFLGGKVGRTPVFRTLSTPLEADPQTLVGYRPSSGYDLVIYGGADGSIYDTLGNDRTPPGRVLSTDARPWTSCFLGDVLYLNRPSHVPAALLIDAPTFVDLDAWDASWRCRSLRAVRDQLFAFNITKGLVELPSTVKWSDITLAGQMPGSWDPTVLSGAANEVLLPKLESPLVDGVPLSDNLVAYAENQIVLFEFTGDTADAGQNLWINRPLFNNAGMISPNCGVEVDGRHYVFGQDDLYVHDGLRRESIATDKVRRFVFRNMNARLADRNFVLHLPKTDEVLFAFVSGDADAVFVNQTRCNRGALYDLKRGTWGLVDLPNISAASLANVDPTLLWQDAGLPRTWSNTGGSWYDLRDGSARHVIMAAGALSGGPVASAAYAYDEMDQGQLAYPMDAAVNPASFVERIALDMDEIGAPLNMSKIVTRLFPQLSVFRSAPVRFRVGSSMTPRGPYIWEDWKVFDPATDYKVDVRRGGRYLGLRMEVPSPADFEFSGFDTEVRPGGRR